MARATTQKSLLDRVENTLKDLEKDWSELQKKADKRRKDFERRADREIKKLQADFRKNPIVKRAEKQRKDLEKRAERLIGLVLRGSTAPLMNVRRDLRCLRIARDLDAPNLGTQFECLMLSRSECQCLMRFRGEWFAA